MDYYTPAPLIAPKDVLDYHHEAYCRLDGMVPAWHVYCTMTNNPSFMVRIAFKIRDVLCRFGRLSPLNGFIQKDITSPPPAGEKADFFDVIEHTETSLLLKSEDKHLAVLLSLQIFEEKKPFFRLTVSVTCYNFLGKIYMLPVGIAHPYIVKKMLNKVGSLVYEKDSLCS